MDLTASELSIVKTLAHFDVLDYPLTLLEIAKFNELGLPATEIFRALNQKPLESLISQGQGLYCLRERETMIPPRLSRYRLALRKLKHARRFAALFSLFPWIRGVALYSSLALKNSKVESDIDLFFIAATGRVWSARFFLNVFLKIFGLRPTSDVSRDRICASYLVDVNNLDLSFANSDSDYFYAYGCASFIFLAGSGELEKDFWLANSWIKKILPAWQPTAFVCKNEAGFWRFLQSLKESAYGLVPETAYQDRQLKILPRKYHDGNDGKKVSLQGGVIKLHDNDKREQYNRLFAENYERVAHGDTDKFSSPVIPTETR